MGDTNALDCLKTDMENWCCGRSALLRLPLWIFIAYITLQQFRDPFYWSIFDYLNLGVHEGGHLIFRFLGEFLCVAGGTFFQLLLPVGSIFMFLNQRDYFGISISFAWIGTNLYNIAVYMADAQKMALDLVTVGDAENVGHDWNFLFKKLGLLKHCESIGWLTRQCGLLAMLAALTLGAWLLWQMFRRPVTKNPPSWI